MKTRHYVVTAVAGLVCLCLAYAAIRLHIPGRLKNRIRTLLVSDPNAMAAPVANTSDAPLPPVRKAFQIRQEIYAGGLKNDWQDWGWADRNIAGPGPATFDLSSYGGWILHHSAQREDFGALVLHLKAPESYGDFLEIRLTSDDLEYEPIVVGERYKFPEPGGWTLVVVPWYELNPYKQPFDGIRVRAFRPVGNTQILLDRIALAEPQPGGPPPRKFPTRKQTVALQCSAPSTAISPLIFGVAGQSAAEELKATAYRFGGNPTSRFNWTEGNIWNTAADWFFRNVRLDWHWKELIERTNARGAEFTVTLPMLGWVAKDASSYSFPVSEFGKQQQVDPDHADIGNGTDANGKELKPRSPTFTSIPAPPELIEKWVTLIGAESAARGRRVHSYILDNEPFLWNSTHRDVHPEPLGYDELLERTIRYGTAIRKADPDAIIAGPAIWGWSNYFWSAKDAAAGFSAKPDRRAHDDTPLLDWYLRKLYEHEKRTGVRILDIVDLHLYPQGKRLFAAGGGGSTDLDASQRRIRATRALWDPTYLDESWIKERISLIPRMKEIIARNYPGRGISIGEWNFGAEGHISGGLATAEALGRFAQTGIRSAYYWTAPKPGSPSYWGFRAFRNFDGKGGAFLERFVPSTSKEGLSVFASKNAAGNHFVVVILVLANTHAIELKFDTKGCGKIGTWKSLVYSGNPDGFAASKSGEGNDISDTLPPYSITVLDFQTAQ